MKRADLVKKLKSLKASELADLAGVSLGRGRPSHELRSALIDDVLDAIMFGDVSVKRDGTIVRK